MSHTETIASEFDLDILKKLVADSITSSLPPVGFDPMTAPQTELLKLGFPSRPHPEFQPAEYAVWQDIFAPPLEFRAFAFDILPDFTAQSGILRAAARDGNPVPTGRVPTSRRATATVVPDDLGQVARSHAHSCPPAAWPPTSTAAQHGSASMGSAGTTGRRCRRSHGTAYRRGHGRPAVLGLVAWWVRNDLGQAYPITIHGLPGSCRRPDQVLHEGGEESQQGVFLIRNVTTNQFRHFAHGAPPTSWHRPFKVPGATAEWVIGTAGRCARSHTRPLADYGTVKFRKCGASAINPDTLAKVERSLSAARLIDMYVVEQNPERTVTISIAKQSMKRSSVRVINEPI